MTTWIGRGATYDPLSGGEAADNTLYNFSVPSGNLPGGVATGDMVWLIVQYTWRPIGSPPPQAPAYTPPNAAHWSLYVDTSSGPATGGWFRRTIIYRGTHSAGIYPATFAINWLANNIWHGTSGGQVRAFYLAWRGAPTGIVPPSLTGSVPGSPASYVTPFYNNLNYDWDDASSAPNTAVFTLPARHTAIATFDGGTAFAGFHTAASGLFPVGVDLTNGYTLRLNETWWGGFAVADLEAGATAIVGRPPYLDKTGGNHAVATWLTVLGAVDPGRCEQFVGRIESTRGTADVTLSVLTNSLDPGTHYLQFITNTTGHSVPSGTLNLAAGPWVVGAIDVGEYVEYAVWRADGAPIGGSAVMRARDTAWGIDRDVTVECLPLPSVGRWVIGRLVA